MINTVSISMYAFEQNYNDFFGKCNENINCSKKNREKMNIEYGQY